MLERDEEKREKLFFPIRTGQSVLFEK